MNSATDHRAWRGYIAAGVACLALTAMAAGCGSPDAPATHSAGATTVATPDVGTAALPVDTATPEPSTTPTVEPATPEPTPTLPDEPTNVPDRMSHLPTASSDSETMALGGHIYVDARPTDGWLLAFIGGQECGKGQAGIADDRAQFVVTITSDAGKPGCGVPGATVSFTLNGQAANETITWRPGFQEGTVDLSVGPAFAIYRGTFSLVPGFRSPLPGSSLALLVAPYINGLPCGVAAKAEENILDHARFVYRVIVDPEPLRAGCGHDGASVVLRLQVEGGPSVDLATVPWQTLPVVPVPNVDLRRVIPAPSPTEAAH